MIIFYSVPFKTILHSVVIEEQLIVSELIKNVVNDAADDLSQSCFHRGLQLLKNYLPVLVQEQVHVVAESFVAAEKILEVQVHASGVKSELKLVTRCLQILLSIPLNDARCKLELDVDIIFPKNGTIKC